MIRGVLFSAIGRLAQDDVARGVRHVPVLGSIVPGTSGYPGSGSFLQGGAMACSVVLELMSGKLTCCIASRWYSSPSIPGSRGPSGGAG